MVWNSTQISFLEINFSFVILCVTFPNCNLMVGWFFESELWAVWVALSVCALTAPAQKQKYTHTSWFTGLRQCDERTEIYDILIIYLKDTNLTKQICIPMHSVWAVRSYSVSKLIMSFGLPVWTRTLCKKCVDSTSLNQITLFHWLS